MEGDNSSAAGDSQDDLRRRWTIIESALLSPMTSSYDIEEAILSYNSRSHTLWSERMAPSREDNSKITL